MRADFLVNAPRNATKNMGWGGGLDPFHNNSSLSAVAVTNTESSGISPNAWSTNWACANSTSLGAFPGLNTAFKADAFTEFLARKKVAGF